MSISNEERFHELAHKILAKEAQPSEHSELKALIRENSKLQEEFERMGAEGVAAREILALLEDVQRPMPGAPPPPMERLRNEIGEVFEPGAGSESELSQILAKLEQWAGRKIGRERERVTQFVSIFRSSFVADYDEADADALAEHNLQVSEVMLAEFDTAHAIEGQRAIEESESRNRQAEFESRLREMEGRIRHAEQIMHECRDEVESLLHAFLREREASDRGRKQN